MKDLLTYLVSSLVERQEEVRIEEFEEDIAGYVGDEDEDEEEEGEEDYEPLDAEGEEAVEASPPPSPDEVRAGFARIAARITAV